MLKWDEGNRELQDLLLSSWFEASSKWWTLNPISTIPYFVKACSRTPWIWWKHQNFLHQARDQTLQVNWKHGYGIVTPEWVWLKKKDFNLWNTWEYERKMIFGDFCSIRWEASLGPFGKHLTGSVQLLNWMHWSSWLLHSSVPLHPPGGFLTEIWNFARHLLFLRKAPLQSWQLPGCPGGKDEGWWAHPALQAGGLRGSRAADPWIRSFWGWEFGALLWDTFAWAEMDFKGW